MSKNLKKMISYYKPYLGVFWADMFFATVSAAVALVIPLVIRYVTSTLIYMEPQAILGQIRWIALMLFALVAVDCYSRFFIANQGHVMGAKIEYDMRAEIFAHFQKLSFSFYDDQKVGQLMSRITTDLFDITELMHHGPENIILSLIKIIGAFVILMIIKPALALAAFAVLPFMFLFAYYMNGKMRRAFRSNRERIADINAQIEGIDAKELGVTEAVYYPVLAKILEENEDIEDIKQEIRRNISELIPKHITKEDIFASINFYDPDPGKCHTCGCRSDRKGKCGYQ